MPSSPLPSLATILRLFSLLSVISISSIAGLLYTYQGKLIYPSGLPAGAREDRTDPAEYGLPFEELWLKTPDGEVLQAWYIRPGAGSGASGKSTGSEANEKEGGGRGTGTGGRNLTIVMFQANAGNIAHRLPFAAVFFNRLGANVLMLSYRGYGRSTGVPHEAGIKVDAQVALDWLRARVHPKGDRDAEKGSTSAHTVVLYGQSLGGAVAIDAAVRNYDWVSGLVLENTFLSIPSLIPTVLPPARFFTFLCREVWASASRLPQLPRTVKVLFLSGRKDELVPPSQMRELYALCRHREGKGKEWAEFEEGTHNDTCMKPGYFPTIASFLHRHLGHKTALSEEAVQRGVGMTETDKSISAELHEEYDSEGGGEGEWERVDGQGLEKGQAGLRKRPAAAGAGAGSLDPKDALAEDVEEVLTEGARAARARGEL